LIAAADLAAFTVVAVAGYPGRIAMNAIKIMAIVLIVAGALGLVYGGFTYTKDTHVAKVGPIEMSFKDKETVNIPIWAGLGAIVAGVALLFVRK
jgi:multidrug transporter EmrE-like cation transporter